MLDQVRSQGASAFREEVVQHFLTCAEGFSQYRPLGWELLHTAQQRQQWRQLLDEYHYLGAPGMVGANLKYFVHGPDGQRLGALGWQSAVAYLGCRDRLLEWNSAQRVRYLDRVVNNVRFLVLPCLRYTQKGRRVGRSGSL